MKSKKLLKLNTGGYIYPEYTQYENNSNLAGTLQNTLSLGQTGASVGGIPGAIAGSGLGLFSGLGQMYNKTDFGQSTLGKIAAFGINPIMGFSNLIANKKRKKYEKAKSAYEKKVFNAENDFVSNRTQSELNNFSTSGNVTNYYANGGNLNLLGKSKNMKKLSDGVYLFMGDKHENGGIKFDTDNDNISDVEVEGGEVYDAINQRVYSDRLEIGDKSFAELAKQNKNDRQTLDNIFQTQELMKNTDPKKVKSGLKQKSYATGGAIAGSILKNLGNSAVGSATTSQVGSPSGFNLGNFNGSSPNFGLVTGLVGNYLTYLQNKKDINKLKINQTPELQSSPNYKYVDASGALKNDIDSLYARGFDSLKTSNVRNKNAATAKMISDKAKAYSSVNNTERSRKEGYDQMYFSAVDQVNARNNNLLNTISEANLNRYNQKISLLNNARNTMLQGTMANLQNNEMRKSDKATSYLSYLGRGDTGVADRNLPDWLKKYYMINGQ